MSVLAIPQANKVARTMKARGASLVVQTASRVPRTGSFALPSDVPGLAAWYRADQGITIATGVSQWNDLSGHGLNLTQVTGANQPAFLPTDQGGQPWLSFNGTSHVLTRAATVLLTATEYSFFTAHQFGTNGTDQVIFSDSDNATGMFVRQFSTGERGLTHPGIADCKDAAAGTAYERWDGIFRTGTTAVFTVNDATQALSAGTTMTAPAAGSVLAIGARGTTPDLFLNGKVAEIVIFARAVTPTEAAMIRAYMKARYQI